MANARVRSSILDALDNLQTGDASRSTESTRPEGIAGGFISEARINEGSPSESSGSQALKRGALEIEAGVLGAELALKRARLADADAASETLNLSQHESFRDQVLHITTSQKASGFHIHYDRESRTERIDRGGPDQAQMIEKFVSSRTADFQGQTTMKDALKYLGLKNLKHLVPGVQVRLMKHQVIGVSWMLRQENDSEHKGGILADEMGLGKTVQMIATMVVNGPKSERESSGSRTTLIVVPAALLSQWKEEIDTKTNDLFHVRIHHGKDKLKSPKDFGKYDVVITTYHTLNHDFGVPNGVDSEDEKAYLDKHGGPISRARFYRVILDEAQLVRNRGTISSRAAARIRATYRWALTGTPITNNLADLYGIIRFGHFRPWNDWEDYNTYVAKPQLTDPATAGLRAQEILRPLMLRRTKDGQIEGEPLLQLPPKEIEVVRLKFSEEERLIYDNFEKRARIRVNKFIKRNALLKSHHEILVMILRLRQLCCHPHLILSMSDGYDDPSLIVGSDDDRELARANTIMGKPWVAEVQKRFMSRARAQEMDFGSRVSDRKLEADNSCPVCDDLYEDSKGRLLMCNHEICVDCLDDLLQSPMPHNNNFESNNDDEMLRAEKAYEQAAASGFRPCPTCKKLFDPKKVFLSSAFEPDPDEVQKAIEDSRIERRGGSSFSRQAKERASAIELSDDSDDDLPSLGDILANMDKPKPKKKKTLDDSDDSSEEEEIEAPSANVLATWKRGNDDMEASTKINALVKYLKDWDEETHNQDKVICYSQWTSVLDLVEIMLQRESTDYLRYDGKMTREQRELAIKNFKRAGGPRVILISLKSGGVGLNLVVANRVINLDLAWNFATESQAYDRAHRVGQSKPVYVKRFVIQDTIEERMLRLQEAKIGLADAALGEGTGGSMLSKLSIDDVKRLFGMGIQKRDQPANQDVE